VQALHTQRQSAARCPAAEGVPAVDCMERIVPPCAGDAPTQPLHDEALKAAAARSRRAGLSPRSTVRFARAGGALAQLLLNKQLQAAPLPLDPHPEATHFLVVFRVGKLGKVRCACRRRPHPAAARQAAQGGVAARAAAAAERLERAARPGARHR
jgi:hypothetical protein